MSDYRTLKIETNRDFRYNRSNDTSNSSGRPFRSLIPSRLASGAHTRPRGNIHPYTSTSTRVNQRENTIKKEVPTKINSSDEKGTNHYRLSKS